MMKKTTLACLGGLVASLAIPSTLGAFELMPQLTPDQFSEARRPITNIVNFDLPIPRSSVRPIYMYHAFPEQVNTTLGPVPLGGDLQLFAVQAELALSDRLSLVAAKDGYIVFNPDGTLFNDAEGFADLALGPKYTFYLDEGNGWAAAGKLILELPMGADRVWQGNGSTAMPSVSVMKLMDEWQFLGMMGLTLPFDMDEESTLFMQSYHVSYSLMEDRIFPLLELNHFHVIDAGQGNANFMPQAGGLVPGVAQFEGGDLVNLGSQNSGGSDVFTMAVGVRGRLMEGTDCGIAWEFPLTDEEDNLMESRITVDIDFSF